MPTSIKLKFRPIAKDIKGSIPFQILVACRLRGVNVNEVSKAAARTPYFALTNSTENIAEFLVEYAFRMETHQASTNPAQFKKCLKMSRGKAQVFYCCAFLLGRFITL